MAKRIGIRRMISLGHDRWVNADAIIAVEPIESNGRYIRTKLQRTRILIAHPEKELIASRTAKTILRDMTEPLEKKENKKPDIISPLVEKMKQRLKSEKEVIINCLIENPTVVSAIQASPYGQTKFYQLVKKYGINTKDYMNVTNDTETYHDDHNILG